MNTEQASTVVDVEQERVLLDPEMNSRLFTDGFVIVPFLEPDEVDHLWSAYKDLRDATHPTAEDSGLTIDFLRDDRTLMRAIPELMEPIWAKHLPVHFDNYRPVVTTFVVKYPGEGSEMALHHEPTFAPLGTRTYNIWIPLVDVDQSSSNGELWLVPGSQRLDYGYVGFNTPVLFRPFDEFLESHGERVAARAGEAVIYETTMLHWSSQNSSDAPRPAIATALTPADAPLIHAVADQNHHCTVYGIDREFFLESDPATAHRSIADSYDAIDTVPLMDPLRSETVATAIGSSGRPEARVLVPEDLRPEPDAPLIVEPISRTPRWIDPAEPLDPDDDMGTLREHGLSTELHGSARAMELIHNRRRSRREVRPFSANRMINALVRNAIIFELDADSRISVQIDWRHPARITTLDCAPLSAGAATDRGVTQFEPGKTVSSGDRTAVTIWNNGPGAARFVIWN